VLEGAPEHRVLGDPIRPGDGQRMSAGTGIRHSEFNALRSEPVHFFLIRVAEGCRGPRRLMVVTYIEPVCQSCGLETARRRKTALNIKAQPRFVT